MERLIAPVGGATIEAADDQVERLLAAGFRRAEAQEKPQPKRRAPRKAQKPQDK